MFESFLFKNQILTTLWSCTCKELARRIEKTGVDAIAVHGR
jgi:tRNA-dihydrouridine synthase